MKKSGIYIILFITFYFFITNALNAQNNLPLTLSNAIEMAKANSTDYYIAKNKYQSGYWQYKSFKSRLLPFISVSSTLADINNSISKITLPDGNDAFIARKLNNSLINLSIRQNIFTGGQIYINSGLQRIDILGENSSVSYLASPVNIGFQQPVLSFNSFKWEKKIEPLQFEKNKRDFITGLENISLKTIELFFNVLITELNNNIATVKYTNNDTIYKIAKKRLQKGLITESDLLRLELNLLNAKSERDKSATELKKAISDFKIYLAIDPQKKLMLVIPLVKKKIIIDIYKAEEMVKLNNPSLLDFKKQQITALRDLEKAKRENQLNANLVATYGLTQSAGRLSNTYINPQDKQSLKVGVEIPVLDWGHSKGNYEMAKSNLEVINLTTQQSEQELFRDLEARVEQFNMQEAQVLIAEKAKKIAIINYDISKKRYLIGKISITDLNIASSDNDAAQRNYLTELKNYWTYYYQIRKITLFDFEQNITITK
ncbi:MAG: TolC family protein [Chlorobi bacterium]|nr:TolC family protein [Chlorobiota bacterium]